jgi:uncharacterized OB-fold protein
MLADALDRAKPGDRILVLSVSDGCRRDLAEGDRRYRVLPRARARLRRSSHPSATISRTRATSNGAACSRPSRRGARTRSAPPLRRRFAATTGSSAFMGTRCTACGTYQLPPQIVCVHCRAVDKMERVPFADRKARIRTFTLDRLAFTLQPPMVVAILDFEGGGRFQCELTDCEPEKVAIGQEVEMTSAGCSRPTAFTTTFGRRDRRGERDADDWGQVMADALETRPRDDGSAVPAH